MTEENKKAIASIIKIGRGKLDITQEELSKRSGVAVNTITCIETCRKEPRSSTLVKLARALGINEDDLLKYC